LPNIITNDNLWGLELEFWPSYFKAPNPTFNISYSPSMTQEKLEFDFEVGHGEMELGTQ